MDNLFEMARKTFVRGLVESTPPRVVIETQIEVIQEQAELLAKQARALREQAENIVRRMCCNDQCNQGRDCPLRSSK